MTSAPQTPLSGSGTDRSYPQEWEADVVLRDGTTVRLRPIRVSDRDALQRFHTGQSERSTYLRFFAAMERLSARDLTRFTVVDHQDRVALVAVATVQDPHGATGTHEEIIGVARFDRIGPGEAEVAFNIADSHQGRGLGSVLLEHIAAAAREVGVRRFTAEVLPQNGKMLTVFREAGYKTSQHVDDGIVAVSIDLDPTERSREVMADREHRAEARSMLGLFTPASIVVVTSPAAEEFHTQLTVRMIGALLNAQGPDPVALTVVGLAPAARRLVDDRLVDDPRRGDHRPADHRPADAAPVTFVDSLAEVPGPVDLAVLATPATEAAAVVRALAPLSVRGVVVTGPGYAETGEDGLALQRAVVRTAHAAGMRVVGPGSYGLFAQRPEVTFNASLAPDLPPPGRVGLFCQSAPMAVTVLATVARRGLGVSSFLSAGNRADVSGNDLMQFWQEDDSTDVVGLYLESIGNPRKFSRIARRLSLVKPVVVVTAGRSGHIAVPGHAVRTTRAPRRTLEEMFRQSGVIRAENTHQMIDIVQLLAHQPLPQGRRVAIVASSAPLAAVVAEAAGSAGLVVTGQVGIVRDGSTQAQVVDAIDAVYAEGACDVVVAVHVPVLGGHSDRFCQAVAQAAARTGRTTVASVLGLHGLVPAFAAPAPDGASVTVPAYSTPEDAVQALGAVVRYSAWRGQDHGEKLLYPDVDVTGARRIIEARAGEARSRDLAPEETRALLGCYGIDVWRAIAVTNVDEAVAAATELGWPVALKSTAAALRHRADLGGVRLNIEDEAELRADYEQMYRALADHLPAGRGAEGTGRFEVQRMAPSGVACVVRSTEDRLYGPVVSFGLSGDATDLLDDVSYGVPPLTTTDVAQMVRSIRAAPRLFGYLGLPEADAGALEDLIGRVCELAEDHPEVQALELYPVVVAEHGAAVLNARVTVAAADRKDGLRRSLPN